MEYAHRVYFEREWGPLKEGLEPDHLCKQRDCINPAHIEAVTRRVNYRRSRKARLTEQKVREIRRAWGAGGVTQQGLAEAYGVRQPAIYKIVHHRTWVDVEDKD